MLNLRTETQLEGENNFGMQKKDDGLNKGEMLSNQKGHSWLKEDVEFKNWDTAGRWK